MVEQNTIHVTAKKIALLWCCAFILLNILDFRHGYTNANSRFAALRAMSHEGKLEIDSYVNWSIDWSQAPSGHFYSNKAPGPALLGLPFFWILDHAVYAWGDWEKVDYFKSDPLLQIRMAICFFTQILPYAFVVFLWLVWLKEQGLSLEARNFAALALLFGNTTSLYMSVFFGHASAAAFLLGGVLAALKERFVLAGFCLAWALLSDYGVAYTLPGFLLALVLWRKDWLRVIGKGAVGALFPGAVWIWYHVNTFGGALELPQKYNNPIFVQKDGQKFWGVLDAWPARGVLAKLLWGPERGILFTQPWVLVVLLKKIQAPKIIMLGSTLGLIGLLWMNATFNGWDGGWCAGPRYLSIIFPLFGVAAAYIWDQSSQRLRAVLILSLLPALLLKSLTYGIGAVVPADKIWNFYFETTKHAAPAVLGKMAICILVMSAAAFLSRRARA